jgi:NTP pyrophosphatase (non-canonical NTP hydrolase)
MPEKNTEMNDVTPYNEETIQVNLDSDGNIRDYVSCGVSCDSFSFGQDCELFYDDKGNLCGGQMVNPLSFAEYSHQAGLTAIYPNRGKNIFYPALKLAGEAGEVAEKVGKAIRDDNWEITEERREGLIKELGDVLWYVSALCFELNVSMSEVAQINIDKLNSRKARGVLKGDGDNR